ncbi:non-structural maintenance of chromosomes element 1 protein [Pelomyxa schiedti]|nr:non-structural maintenance of chromosomes element 1 protein [Pelomyxa schiedti]
MQQRTQALLQVFMSRRVMTMAEMTPLSLLPADAGTNQRIAILEKMIKDINETIGVASMEIRSQLCETSGVKFWALVSTAKSDDVIQPAPGQSPYSPNDLKFFRTIIEKIAENVTSDNPANPGVIPISEALSACEDIKDAKPVLDLLVQDNWLSTDAAGKLVSLGRRTMAELGQYLSEACNDSPPECPLCHLFVFQARICPHEACRTRLHKHCARRWFQDNGKCPTCDESWKSS